MKKIGDVTSTADKNGEWTNGNVAAGIPPTVLESGWLNSVQREILGVLTKAGIPQDKNNDNQLSEAISKIITGGNYATAEDLKKKLTKNENGADIPNKTKFIENLGLPEKYQPRGKYAVTDSDSTQLFTGPVFSSDTVGAQSKDGKIKSLLYVTSGGSPSWGAHVDGVYAGALKHPLKDGTAATIEDVNEVKNLALGVGQVWQVVTRGNGSTNTNNTGRTLAVNVIRYTGVSGTVSVNGVSVAAFRGGRTDTSPVINVDMTVTAIVPPGARYIISWSKEIPDAGEPKIVELR